MLITDHKPLTTLLSPKRGVPTVAAARMQRWALLLTAYSYDIEFRRTHEHSSDVQYGFLCILHILRLSQAKLSRL